MIKKNNFLLVDHLLLANEGKNIKVTNNFVKGDFVSKNIINLTKIIYITFKRWT